MYLYSKCYPIPKPCPFCPTPIVRPMILNVQRSYDLFFCHFYDIIIFVLILCVAECYLACTLFRKTRFVTFNTRLNTLPIQLRAKSLKLDLVYYVVLTMSSIPRTEGYIELISYRIYMYLSAFLIKVSKCLPFKFCFLCFFKLILILSADIETQPGPRSGTCTFNGFNDGFLSFCNWNVNTLSKNDFERVTLIEAHNSLFKYDIISLCETSLNDDVAVPEDLIKGYRFFSLDHPSGEKKGGVGIFYKETLPLKIRNDLSFEECIVVELIFGHKKIFFTVLYRNPINKADSPEFANFIHNFEQLYQNILNENPFTMLFAGDFNAHSTNWWHEGDNTSEGIQLDNLFEDLNLTQLISEPTHFREHCNPSCIDLFLSDQPNVVLESGVRPSLDPTCKHQITYSKINFKIPPAPPYVRKIWHFNRANSALISKAVAQFPWQQRLEQISEDPTLQVELLNETVLNIMSNFVPNSLSKIKPSEPEWLNRKIKAMLKKQNRLYKKYKRNGFNEDDKLALEVYRSECAKYIETSKQNHLHDLGNKLANKCTGQKTYWKIVNNFLNKSKIPRIPPLLVDNKFVINCKEKASLFNNYFVAQCQPFISNSFLPPPNPLTRETLDHFVVTNEQILNILLTLNVNKAHGPDKISVNMIKLCGKELVVPLKLIFQNILNTGIFPDQWKRANVTPIHKKDDKQTIKNYRPISLLPVFAKVYERIVFTNLYNHFIDNNLITSNQSGFRPGDSVTNQLIYLVHEIHTSFDSIENSEVRSVYLDMSKAFDKVWHEGLIYKLKQNGINGNLLKLLKSYLSKRKQRVVLNGMESDWGDIKSGVPQGSVLGPLLFLIYINDLEKGIKSSIKFFADDTSLFSIVKNPHVSAQNINHDLQLISQWAVQWKMSFNPDLSKPAEEVIFSHKRHKSVHPPLFFNNVQVKQVNEHKHLGLILDSKLTFDSHINEKLAKARKGIGVIKYLSTYVSVKTLDQIYKMYVRPHLDFCDVIYHIPKIPSAFDSSIRLVGLMERIERIQYQAALAVTGAWKGTSLNKIYDELGWETLTDRRWFRRLVQLYKIRNGLTPDYLKIPLPATRGNRYGTRSVNEFHDLACRTTSYTNSFYPNSIKIWNEIGPELRQVRSLSEFKSKILNIIRPVKKSVFHVHDPTGIRRLFQIRVGLSPLNEHKKRHNFRDTISDICHCQTHPETTDHFLLHCDRFIEARHDMFEVVNPILIKNNLRLPNNTQLVKLLLYGHVNLCEADNISVISGTLNFIHKSTRFESE